MGTKFNLSKRICKAHCENEVMLEVDDVRNFIRRLKKELSGWKIQRGISDKNCHEIINELAGEELAK